MTQRKTTNFEQGGMPGLSKINDIVSMSFSMWTRHVQTLNEVFTDCTREDATLSTYPKAWTKLLHSVTANAEDLCAVLMGHGCADAEGCPLVTFVIDRSAETDAQPQTVRVPAGVDVTKVVATRLVSLTDNGDPANATIVLLPVDDYLEIRVAIQTPGDSRTPTPGSYLSVVCEPKAGAPTGRPFTDSPDPPSRTVVATVLVVFV